MAADDAAVTVTLRAELKGYEAALKSAVRATERAAKASEDAFASIGKKKPFTPINDNFQKSAGQIANDARVLQFQLNDIFSGLASGQGIRALQMQLGQIAQQLSGGSLAAGARTMGAALAGMVNPISLAVVAFGLAATAAANYFSESEDGAGKATKETEQHLAALRKLADAYNTILPGIDAYVTKQERAAVASERLKTALADQASQQQKIDTAFKNVDAGDILNNLFIQIQQNAGAAAETMQNELLAALTKFQQAQAEGKGVQEAWNELVARATDLEKKFGDGSATAAEALKKLGDSLRTNVKELEDATTASKFVVGSLDELKAALQALIGVDPTGLLAIIDMLGRQFPDALGAAQGARLRRHDGRRMDGCGQRDQERHGSGQVFREVQRNSVQGHKGVDRRPRQIPRRLRL